MKYLLVLLVVMVGVWVWRSNRQQERFEARTRPAAGARGRAPDAVEMIGCDLCGVHCPNDDLVRGRKGVYCCAQHRDQAEARSL